ncbi:MAG: hypothetical protein B6D44_12145 [Ignavibacteriales bacterium UTCHB2]|nr:MAG: hypothetical protein B6D44_12145 [Ignavibacteriales bacterium UTCHB2]
MGNKVELNWTAATETNNSEFEILRGVYPAVSGTQNDSEWKTVGFVAGFGTTTEPKTYSFTDSEVSAGKYIYRLKQIDFDGSFEYSPEVEVEVFAPLTFSLEQNYPNPFNPNTTIKYSTPEKSFIKIFLYDVKGEKVVDLINEEKEAGIYTFELNSKNLSSGVYLYRMTSSNGYNLSKKLIILK